MFTLHQTNDHDCILICTATGREYPFRYQRARLCEKLSSGYKIESDWSGTAQQLYDALIPKLNLLRTLLKPTNEEFNLGVSQDEYTYNDTCYCSEFHITAYCCTLANGPEVTIVFKNADLLRINAPALDPAVRELIERLVAQALKPLPKA